MTFSRSSPNPCPVVVERRVRVGARTVDARGRSSTGPFWICNWLHCSRCKSKRGTETFTKQAPPQSTKKDEQKSGFLLSWHVEMGSLFWTIQVDVDGHLRIGTLRVKARVEALGDPQFADHGAPVHQGVHAVLHPRWSQITLSKSRPRRPRASLRSDMATAWLRVLRLSPTTSSLSIPVTNSNSCNNLHRATSRCPGSCNTFKLRALKSDLLSAPQDQLQSPRLGRCPST